VRRNRADNSSSVAAGLACATGGAQTHTLVLFTAGTARVKQASAAVAGPRAVARMPKLLQHACVFNYDSAIIAGSIGQPTDDGTVRRL